ncbi:MAG: hypothetical protein GWO02_23080 [Gammaproteobacteria bacterium]|nr:hypothetical protein [Gammaproteobacteria bacterium]
MFENAIYSVISPEGCAAILWKTNEAKDKAAAALRLTAPDLASLGVIDGVIPEPVGGAHADWDAAADALRDALARNLDELRAVAPDERLGRRLEKFGRMGEWRTAVAGA